MFGTATLTNTNVYSNQATEVRSPFQLSLNFHPSPRWCLTFALAARRAVVSMSDPTQWLALKAAISMTTPLLLCACILEPFPELSSIAPMERYALHFLARREVVYLSKTVEWLILKAAISMTTRLLTCACLLPLP